ncbi:hypothetical protein LXL04_022160 [Taraxacum kok-saghyz]
MDKKIGVSFCPRSLTISNESEGSVVNRGASDCQRTGRPGQTQPAAIATTQLSSLWLEPTAPQETPPTVGKTWGYIMLVKGFELKTFPMGNKISNLETYGTMDIAGLPRITY